MHNIIKRFTSRKFIVAAAGLAGTIAAPRINGRMDLREGGFRDNATGLQLRDMTLASRFDDTTAMVESFSATDGSGGRTKPTKGGGSVCWIRPARGGASNPTSRSSSSAVPMPTFRSPISRAAPLANSLRKRQRRS